MKKILLVVLLCISFEASAEGLHSFGIGYGPATGAYESGTTHVSLTQNSLSFPEYYYIFNSGFTLGFEYIRIVVRSKETPIPVTIYTPNPELVKINAKLSYFLTSYNLVVGYSWRTQDKFILGVRYAYGVKSLNKNNAELVYESHEDGIISTTKGQGVLGALELPIQYIVGDFVYVGGKVLILSGGSSSYNPDIEIKLSTSFQVTLGAIF